MRLGVSSNFAEYVRRKTRFELYTYNRKRQSAADLGCRCSLLTFLGDLSAPAPFDGAGLPNKQHQVR